MPEHKKLRHSPSESSTEGNEKKKSEEKKKTFTKIAVAVILANALAWVWCSYFLAFLGLDEIAESLSETAIKIILGTFITYAVKALVENVSKYGLNLHRPEEGSPEEESKTINNNRDC